MESRRVSELVEKTQVAVWEILVRCKNCFFFHTVRVVKDSNRFARQFVESPLLETFKT